MTIDEAIKNDSYHSLGDENIIIKGDPLGVIESSGVNFINVLRTAFAPINPKSVKRFLGFD